MAAVALVRRLDWVLLAAIVALGCSQASAKVPRAQTAAAAVTDLRITVFPPLALAVPGRGATASVTVAVPISDEARLLVVGWQYAYPGDSGHFTRELDDSSPRQFVRVFDRIPPGVTVFTAEVLHGSGKLDRVEAKLEVR